MSVLELDRLGQEFSVAPNPAMAAYLEQFERVTAWREAEGFAPLNHDPDTIQLIGRSVTSKVSLIK